MRSERVVIIGLGVALAASVAGNLMQSRQRSVAASTPNVARDASVAASTSGVATPGAREAAAHEPPASAAGDVPRELAASCPQQLGAITERLAEAEQKLAERLDPEERWAQGGEPVVDEAELQAGLAKVFEGAPPGTSFDLDCRGSVCQIEVTEREGGAVFDWNSKIQEGFLHERAQGYMMVGGTPTHDLVSGDALMVRRVYAEMNRAGTISGHEVIEAALARFRDSGAPARCAAADPTPGFLSVRIDVAPAQRRLLHAIGGEVAGAAVGRCLAEALAAALDATEVPPHARSAARYLTITTPP